jgi:hypothetical protein
MKQRKMKAAAMSSSSSSSSVRGGTAVNVSAPAVMTCYITLMTVMRMTTQMVIHTGSSMYTAQAGAAAEGGAGVAAAGVVGVFCGKGELN